MSNPDDKVGFKRPPTDSQFKRGKSGNPRGRPKGSRNFKTDLQDTLSQPVKINELGRSRQISTQQASLARLREKALNGDHRALNQLITLAERHTEEETAAFVERNIASHEQEILSDFAARIRDQVLNELSRGTVVDASTLRAGTSKPTSQNLTEDKTQSQGDLT